MIYNIHSGRLILCRSAPYLWYCGSLSVLALWKGFRQAFFFALDLRVAEDKDGKAV
jgi:hypothetical protein